MCGIAGWYRRGGRPVPDSALAAQCAALFHRGPDEGGMFADGDFGFGMRRLSIQDVAHGHQPMASPDGRFTLVFNGEIYNHLALRPDLEAAGWRFETHCDTETLLAAFVHWGNDAWPRLEGMYTAALWDRRERRLTLGRDPLGIKPLYVSGQKGGLSFASELKAITLLPDHDFDVDERAVHDFFSYGHVRRPRSIYRQAYQLEPGHWLELGPEGEARAGCFWRPRLRVEKGVSEAEWVERMRAILLATVRRHMLSDVPVASFLSGGVDSSAVTAAMVRVSDRPIKAFTIGYPGARIDESAAAAEVAHHLGVEHVVRPVALDEAAAILPIVQHCYDEPFAPDAAIPTWYLSKLAAEEVKVVLCGEGGDELFAGYNRHRNARDVRRWRPLLRALAPVAPLLHRHGARAAEYAALPDGYQQFFAGTQLGTAALRRRLYTPRFLAEQEPPNGLAAQEREYAPLFDPAAGNPLDQFLLADLTVSLPSAMLPRLDRASMAHSLEARVPFLSHLMVDWSLTLPTAMKLHGRTGKYVLRRAVADWLPPSVMHRPKQGFQMPLDAWFRGGLGDFALAAWNDSGAAQAGYLEPDSVTRLLAEHRSGRADHGRMLYAIAMFSCWWTERKAH
ncbi:MAG TPA: asparagine synthase (glutamine-hydrolyzing) [Allosphingosinicella sp.]|nr:asparagine synthase (glutamine-hydrolyzing) [Allosphingosinicella sp.]